MKNKLNPNEVIFSLNSNENESVKNIDLMDVEEMKTPYDKVKQMLKIKKDNYNFYLIDSFLQEKMDELVKLIEKEYEHLEAPKDVCYVTIEDEKKPFPVFTSNGRGKNLKEDINSLKEEYKNAMFDFNTITYTDEKEELLEGLKVNRSKYLNKLVLLASDEGFDMKATSDGFVFIPLEEGGDEMSESTYDNLEDKIKEELLEKAEKLKEESTEILYKLKDLELKSSERLKEILIEYLDERLKDLKDDILLEYILDDDVYNYLERFYKSVESNLVKIYNVDIEEDDKEVIEVMEKYFIEVVVDNIKYNHPRVIFEEDPSIIKLLGNIEYENQNGNYTTDLSLITAGSLLEANEGCIILRLKDIIISNSYHYLKKTLLSKKLTFDANKNYLEVLSINGLKLEPVNINVKVIILGDYESYNILYNNDEDFKNLFPVKIEIPTELKLKGKLQTITDYIVDICTKVSSLDISDEGIEAIIKSLVRTTSNKEKIKIDYKEIEKIILLSEQIAFIDQKEEIDKACIEAVIYEKDVVEEEYMSMYTEGKVIISLEGKRVGNINGLAVLDTGTHSFGKPMRITCKVYKGDGNIYDIHKEAKLSGRIHEKSIGILKSILWSKGDLYEKLPINIYLSFEQSYGLIDGDSASVAEMLCMLSAITGKGLNQNIAVTGSLNQFCEVQPIGGAIEKIEGFYRVCKELGKLNKCGVLIPKSNVNEVILKDEIEKEILKDNFSIYSMETLDDAIEIFLLEEGETLEEFYKLLREKIAEYKK